MRVSRDPRNQVRNENAATRAPDSVGRLLEALSPIVRWAALIDEDQLSTGEIIYEFTGLVGGERFEARFTKWDVLNIRQLADEVRKLKAEEKP